MGGRWTVLCVLLSVLGTAAPASARLTVEPSVSLQERWTDNVGLDAAPAATADLVTEVAPQIDLSATGRRSTLDLRYRYQYLDFRRSDEQRDYQQYKAEANSILVQDMFRLNASVQKNQYNALQSGQIAADNLSLTDNRTDVFTAQVHPAFEYEFGPSWSTNVDYRWRNVDYESGAFRGSDTNALRARLHYRTPSRRLRAGLVYSYSDTQEEARGDTVFERVGLDGEYDINPEWTTLASAGYERNEYDFSITEPPEGSEWHVGLRVRPTPRLSGEFRTGERYFGSVQSLDLTYRGRRLTARARYREDVTHTPSYIFVRREEEIFGQLFDVDQTIQITEVFVLRSASLSLDYDHSRTRLRAVLSRDRRSYQQRLIDEDVVQARLEGTLELTAKTTAGMTLVGRSRDVSNVDDDDVLYYGRLYAETRTGRGIYLGVEYGQTRRDTTVASPYDQRYAGITGRVVFH